MLELCLSVDLRRYCFGEAFGSYWHPLATGYERMSSSSPMECLLSKECFRRFFRLMV